MLSELEMRGRQGKEERDYKRGKEGGEGGQGRMCTGNRATEQENKEKCKD